MAVQKQNVNINFSQGLDTKTDPYQVSVGKFLSLQNSIFLKGGLLTKRNGYGILPRLPDSSSTFITTFNGDLTVIGSALRALSSGYGKWVDRGSIQPVGMDVLPLIRNNTSQTQVDTAISSNGLVCTVYTDQDPSNLSNSVYKYAIADVITGQNLLEPTVISEADEGFGTPRVFLLANSFVIIFTNKVVSTYHLKYFAISTINVENVTSPADITTSYDPSTTVAFDGAVFNNNLYVAWNGASSSGINTAIINSTLSVSGTINVDASHSGTIISVTVDSVNGVIWISYYDSGTSDGYVVALDQNRNSILVPTLVGSGTLLNITSSANAGILTVLFEVSNNYSYDGSIPTHYVQSNTVTQAGVVGTPATVLRSVGLASKAFRANSQIYWLATYSSPYQPTYFLADIDGNIIAKLAYGNGQGYLTLGLPSVSVDGSVVKLGYLLKDLIQSVNKNTNVPSGSQVAGVYSQLGINLIAFTIQTDVLTAEIGNNLNISGGFLWGYDGYTPAEQGFFLWPDSVKVTTATSGGSLSNQIYYYQVTYEWTDNQGNAFRSAPSIPVTVTTTGSNVSANTIHVPTLRLTYKTANPVKIVIYRWSTAQQVYYQVTSIITPVLNSTSTDQVQYVDTTADANILGNNILYTNGGVIENIGGPAFDSVFIFDDRLWGIDSEDKNLLWFSKQVLQATPVEMSDLLTLYVAPNIGAQGSTGPLLCGAQMDDKAILFKGTAINYIAGTGPDNTGANSQYTQPTFITATVGCSNQKSIVFQPQGLMFEFASEAGNQIWLLGRDLTTQYIGAPVEQFTQNATVQSAVNVPGTNQVRFTMSSGITLMYDYYYQQWGTFVNVPAVSSTLYQGLHTYINSIGQVFQETPGLYLDNASPVLMSFSTSWISFAGLQGYQRAYFFSLLGTYYSPHKLNVLIGYDYNSSPSSNVVISPNNFSPVYGADLTYGSGTPYGGAPTLEQWRIFFSQQRCESFQIIIQEIFDPSFGVVAGKGLTLSGLDVVVGIKKGWKPYRASTSVGAS